MGSIVRLGKVTAIDAGKYLARVKFLDEDMTSGWLPVLQHPRAVVSVNPADGHTHGASAGYWMPKVNEMVLGLYPPIFNADGYILGVVVT